MGDSARGSRPGDDGVDSIGGEPASLPERGGRFGRRHLLGGVTAAALATGTSAALPSVAHASTNELQALHRGQEAPSGSHFDVIVIGAGLAGLSAATVLKEGRRRVLVLEARSRVGGRTYDIALGHGAVAEMGGEWTGPGQTSVQALAKDLGVRLFPTYSTGENLYYYSGRLQRYAGDIPPAAPAALAQTLQLINRLNAMASPISATSPWAASASPVYDRQSVGSWAAGLGLEEEALFLVNEAVRGIYGEEASQISLLDLLGEIAGVGGDLNTAIGSAQSVAVAIDSAQWPEVVGTISGDDTIFIATASADAQRKLGERLLALFGR